MFFRTPKNPLRIKASYKLRHRHRDRPSSRFGSSLKRHAQQGARSIFAIVPCQSHHTHAKNAAKHLGNSHSPDAGFVTRAPAGTMGIAARKNGVLATGQSSSRRSSHLHRRTGQSSSRRSSHRHGRMPGLKTATQQPQGLQASLQQPYRHRPRRCRTPPRTR